MEALGRYLVKNEDYFIKWTYIWVDFCQHQDSKNILGNSVFKRANKRYQQAACDFLGIQDLVLASFVLSFVNGLILEKLWGDETIDISRTMCFIRQNADAIFAATKNLDNIANCLR